MKLPNAHLAVVEREKLTGYLLDLTHRHGASKARFFSSFGFDVESFAVALHEHGRRHDVSRTRETPFGPRYEIEGALPSPDGRVPHVRTVWQMDTGDIAPRLITAYPLVA